MLIQKELEILKIKGEYGGEFQPLSHFFGYEGRCAIPSNFDAQYCYSIGRNAAALISLGYTGYMSTIKNLSDSDPHNWICSGCPLPAMMGMEKRKGKMKPVITKFLVELDSPMYKAYEQFRESWMIYDCYRCPGPIQFHEPHLLDVPFLVKAPDMAQLEKETQERIDIENKKYEGNTEPYFRMTPGNLSKNCRERTEQEACLPSILENNTYSAFAVKKATPHTLQIEK